MDLNFLKSPWGFGSIATLTAGACFTIWRVGYIAFGKFQAGRNTEKAVSPHIKCPHAKDIMDVIHRTSEYYEKVQTLRNSIIQEQMRYYEEVEEEVRGTLKQSFVSLLVAKLPSEEQFIYHADYAYFNLVLTVVVSELKSSIKEYFKSNHYITYDIEAQHEYVDRKQTALIQKFNEMFDLYWRGTVVTRQEINTKNKEKESFYKESIGSIFNRAFLISRDTYSRIEKLDKEYQDYVENIVGTTSGCRN